MTKYQVFQLFFKW